jgi:hypothetical protein
MLAHEYKGARIDPKCDKAIDVTKGEAGFY